MQARTMWPVKGKVKGRTVDLKDGYPLEDGTSVEGWALEAHETPPERGPLTMAEARRLLGPDVVAACARRGIDLEGLAWETWSSQELTPSSWYAVIPNLDYADPWPVWLPMFVHLLRMVEVRPEEVEGHTRQVEVVTTGLLERRDVAPSRENARLVTLLMLRIVEHCTEAASVGPHHLFEIYSHANTVIWGCVAVEERAGPR